MTNEEPPAGMDAEEWAALPESKRRRERYETTSKIVVREYTDNADYERDADEMMGYGWEVGTVVERRPRAGCLRIVTLGLWTLVFPPKPLIHVTYIRGKDGNTPRRRRRR